MTKKSRRRRKSVLGMGMSTEDPLLVALRRLRGEQLENRLMLDGGLVSSVVSATQKNELLSGLEGLSTWAGSLDQSSLLSSQIPIIDQSLGTAINFGSLLQTGLVNPLQNTSISTTTDIVNALQLLSSTANGLSVTVNPTQVSGGESTQSNDLQFSLVFAASRITQASFDLGSNAEQFGLTGANASVSLTANLNFSFTFGLNLDPTLSASDAFFIDVNSLTVTASAQLNNSNSLQAHVGVLGLQVLNASFNLNAGVSVNVTSPSGGNVTLTQLQNASMAQLVSMTPTAATLNATLPVQATIGSWTSSGSPNASESSSNLFSGVTPQLTFNSDFTPLLAFNRLTPNDFTNLFNELGSALNNSSGALNVENSSTSQPIELPFVDQQVSQLVNFQQMMSHFTSGIQTQVIQGGASAPANGQLTADAVFSIAVGNNAPISVTIPAASTQNDQSLDNLVAQINAALPSGLAGQIMATRNGATIELVAISPTVSQFQIQIANPTNTAATELGFTPGQQSVLASDFTTLQTLAQLLAQVMGATTQQVNLQFNPTTQTLSFVLDYADGEFTQLLPLNFSTGLGPLSFEGAANATVTVKPTLDATFGIKLGGLQTTLTATASAPANGVLSANANFSLVVGNNSPVNVTVTAASTANNESLANLVTELNNALASAGVSNTVVAGQNSQGEITLTDSSGNLLQVSAQATDPAILQLHLPTQAAIQDFVDNVSLGSGQLSISATASASSITGSAAVGSLAVGIQNANFSLSAGTGFTFGSVSLGSLLNDVTTQLSVQSSTANLQGQFPLTVSGVNLGINSSSPPAINLSLGTSNNLASVTATPNSAFNTLVSGFSQFTGADVGQAMQNAASLLQGSDVGAFSAALPLINQSLNGLLGTSSLLNAVSSTLDAVGNLSSLQAAVNNVLQTVLTGTGNLPANGVLTSSANFSLAIDGQAPVLVTVPSSSTNESPSDLVSQVNAALATAGIAGTVVAGLSGSKITLTDPHGDSLQVSANATDSAITQLHLPTTPGNSFRTAITSLPVTVSTTQLINLATDLSTAVQMSTTAAQLASAVVATAAALSDEIQTLEQQGIAASTLTAVSSVLTQLQSVVPSVQTLTSYINTALGLQAPNSLSLQFVQGVAGTGNQDQAILVDLHLAPAFSQQVPLGSLGLGSGLGSLGFASGDSVNVAIGGSAEIDFGYDLTNNSAFLQNTTSFGLTAQIAANNLNLSGTIGGVSITSNPASITLSNAANTGPATITFSPTPSADPWIQFSQLSPSSFQFNVNGQFAASLPLAIAGTSVGAVSATLNLQNTSSLTVTPPTGLAGYLDGANFSYPLLTQGIGGFLSQFQTGLTSQLEELPLIGHDLNIGGGFIGALGNDFLTPLENALTGTVNPQQVITNALNQLGAHLQVNSPSVQVTNDAITVMMDLQGTDSYTSSFNANLGGLGLNVKTHGGVNISLGYDVHLGFELSKTQGFFIILNPDARPSHLNLPQYFG